MKNILLLLGVLGLIAFRTEALESEEDVSELAAADSQLVDFVLEEDFMDDEENDEVALAEDEEELRPRPCKDLKCYAYRCKKNCKGGKKCQCNCKKQYGAKVPERFTDLKCPNDPKPASGGSPTSGGSSGSGGSKKPCTNYRCARYRCKKKCKGSRRQRSTCMSKCNRKYQSNIDICKTKMCRFNECAKKCSHPRCRYGCRRKYLEGK